MESDSVELSEGAELELYDELLINDADVKCSLDRKEKGQFDIFAKENAELKKEVEELKKLNEFIQKQNAVLKRNISVLYKTAKSESDRKDQLLRELQSRYDAVVFRRTQKRGDETTPTAMLRQFPVGHPEGEPACDHQSQTPRTTTSGMDSSLKYEGTSLNVPLVQGFHVEGARPPASTSGSSGRNFSSSQRARDSSPRSSHSAPHKTEIARNKLPTSEYVPTTNTSKMVLSSRTNSPFQRKKVLISRRLKERAISKRSALIKSDSVGDDSSRNKTQMNSRSRERDTIEPSTLIKCGSDGSSSTSSRMGHSLATTDTKRPPSLQLHPNSSKRVKHSTSDVTMTAHSSSFVQPRMESSSKMKQSVNESFSGGLSEVGLSPHASNPSTNLHRHADGPGGHNVPADVLRVLSHCRSKRSANSKSVQPSRELVDVATSHSAAYSKNGVTNVPQLPNSSGKAEPKSLEQKVGMPTIDSVTSFLLAGTSANDLLRILVNTGNLNNAAKTSDLSFTSRSSSPHLSVSNQSAGRIADQFSDTQVAQPESVTITNKCVDSDRNILVTESVGSGNDRLIGGCTEISAGMTRESEVRSDLCDSNDDHHHRNSFNRSHIVRESHEKIHEWNEPPRSLSRTSSSTTRSRSPLPDRGRRAEVSSTSRGSRSSTTLTGPSSSHSNSQRDRRDERQMTRSPLRKQRHQHDQPCDRDGHTRSKNRGRTPDMYSRNDGKHNLNNSSRQTKSSSGYRSISNSRHAQSDGKSRDQKPNSHGEPRKHDGPRSSRSPARKSNTSRHQWDRSSKHDSCASSDRGRHVRTPDETSGSVQSRLGSRLSPRSPPRNSQFNQNRPSESSPNTGGDRHDRTPEILSDSVQDDCPPSLSSHRLHHHYSSDRYIQPDGGCPASQASSSSNNSAMSQAGQHIQQNNYSKSYLDFTPTKVEGCPRTPDTKSHDSSFEGRSRHHGSDIKHRHSSSGFKSMDDCMTTLLDADQCPKTPSSDPWLMEISDDHNVTRDQSGARPHSSISWHRQSLNEGNLGSLDDHCIDDDSGGHLVIDEVWDSGSSHGSRRSSQKHASGKLFCSAQSQCNDPAVSKWISSQLLAPDNQTSGERLRMGPSVGDRLSMSGSRVSDTRRKLNYPSMANSNLNTTQTAQLPKVDATNEHKFSRSKICCDIRTKSSQASELSGNNPHVAAVIGGEVDALVQSSVDMGHSQPFSPRSAEQVESEPLHSVEPLQETKISSVNSQEQSHQPRNKLAPEIVRKTQKSTKIKSVVDDDNWAKSKSQNGKSLPASSAASKCISQGPSDRNVTRVNRGSVSIQSKESHAGKHCVSDERKPGGTNQKSIVKTQPKDRNEIGIKKCSSHSVSGNRSKNDSLGSGTNGGRAISSSESSKVWKSGSKEMTDTLRSRSSAHPPKKNTNEQKLSDRSVVHVTKSESSSNIATRTSGHGKTQFDQSKRNKEKLDSAVTSGYPKLAATVKRSRCASYTANPVCDLEDGEVLTD